MKYIQGQNREQIQLFPVSFDSMISLEHEIRLIDAFVDGLELGTYGFTLDQGENGRPAYHPGDLLKLFIYGYLNRIRSSCILEKECKRNIEVMGLMKTLSPDHNTISNFRKDNPTAIKTVQLAKHFNLIAGDSTKLRAQNSKKNNFNEKKIDRHLEYIENKLSEYEKALAESDGDKEAINNEINKQKERKDNYKELEKQLEKTGQAQISTSDSDSRQMITRNNITEVAYNIQTTVDAKNYIPIDYKVTNTNDSKVMGNMLRRAKSILPSNDFTVLYDKGYHTGSEFQENIEQNKKRIQEKQELYKQRQSIVEHPYGTIKRQWGYDHVMTKKTKQHASADVGLILVAYNLRRLFNIIDKKQLFEYLRMLVLYFFSIVGISKSIFRSFKLQIFNMKKWGYIFYNPINRIYLNQI